MTTMTEWHEHFKGMNSEELAEQYDLLDRLDSRLMEEFDLNIIKMLVMICYKEVMEREELETLAEIGDAIERGELRDDSEIYDRSP